MGAQTAHARKQITSTVPRGLFNKALGTEHKTVLGSQQPARESIKGRYIGRVSNPRPTVSAAGVLKKKKKSDDTREKKTRRHRKETPEPDLLVNYKDGIKTARDAILSNAQAAFDSAHKSLVERLSEAREGDEVLLRDVAATLAVLSAPLTEEQVETTTRLGSKRVTEIVKVGDRIARFKKFIETEEAKLKEHWKQWDELQNEYLELGIEVFGAEPFGEDAKEVKGSGTARGYRKGMELLDLELKTTAEELDEEIQELGAKAMQKMKASEKEQDALAKKQQVKILQALLQD